jgi:signal transduction histidine kinase
VWIVVDNAIKYSKPSGTISITLESFDGQAKIVVQDNGIGISPTDLPFVFDRFYRADPSRGTVEGSGLGLAIAKWIAETHQADLSVTSDALNGTCFSIRFPIAWVTEAHGPATNWPLLRTVGTSDFAKEAMPTG